MKLLNPKLRFLFATHLIFIAAFAVTFFNGLITAPANAATDGWHIRDDATGGECSAIGIWDAGSKTCTLTQDLSQGMIIDSDYIILDGNSHVLTGGTDSWGYNIGNGVYLYGRAGVTIKNLNINKFMRGILLDSSNNNTLIGNTANSNNIRPGSHKFSSGGIVLGGSNNNTLIGNTANSNYLSGGIVLEFSNNNTLKGNITSDNQAGIYLRRSYSNILTSSTASKNYYGILLAYSSNNTLADNTAQENTYYDVFVDMSSDSDCNNNITNTTGSGGRPIKYFSGAVSLSNETLSELILCNADGSSIDNITIDGSSTKQNNGLVLIFTDSSTIANVNSSNNAIGIDFLYADNNNTLTGNTTSNNNYGIGLSSSSNNTLTGNTTNSNNSIGISIHLSSNGNTLTSNTSNFNNLAGIYIYNSGNNNTLTGNTVSNNNRYGIGIDRSEGNIIYRNNFINNLDNSPADQPGNNIFNLAEPTGGNYWSNFDTPAEGCNDVIGDGFCDAPYIFDGGQDNLPWTKKDGWLTPSNHPPAPDDHIYYLSDIPEGFIFENDLSPASTPNNAEGECITKSDVRYLQVILAEEGPSIYPASIVNGCFRALTEDAVANFQKKYGVDPLGVVGPITRAKLNERLEAMKESVRVYGSRTDFIKTNINKFTTSMVEENFPSVLVLGIAAQETGVFYNFNNELLRSLTDPGRGIMQLTTNDYVGAGSLEVSDDVVICKNISTWADAEACYRYYANTPRGIEANIKDSLYGLHEKVTWEKLLYRYNTCLDDEANGKVSDFSKNLEYGISCADMKYLGAVQGYNSFTKYVHLNSESYMLEISKKLDLLGNIFLLTEDEQNKASDMATNAKLLWDNSVYIRVYSPVELRVIDSEGRATGVKYGQIQELIPFSTWYPGQEAVGIDFANDVYRYEIVGTTTGTYGFEVINPTKNTNVVIQNIPTNASTTHIYMINWDLLQQGEPGVQLEIEKDGDGIPENVVQIGNNFSDTIAPSTILSITGTQGENGWHVSTSTITLTAQDNDGGVGVEKIEYSLDNGNSWQTYTAPFTITSEGTTNILYRSQDFFGNSEPMKSQEIKIDKTPPEAKIFFNQNLQQLKIEGVDNLSSVTVVQNGNNYTLTDEAGHTLAVDFDKLKTEGKEIKAEIHALHYNGILAPAIPENKLQYEWSLEKNGDIKELNQRIEIEKTFDVRARYDRKKNETAIDIKTEDEKDEEKTKQTFQGLTTLILITNSGNFDIKYNH